MILQKLYEYYQRLILESNDVAPEGFERKEIPFIIVLSHKGEFVGLQDTRQGEGKKKIARSCLVPRSIKRTVDIAANLLWDNPSYVLGRPKIDKNKDLDYLEKRSKDQHAAFIARIHEVFDDIQDDGISAVLAFLERGDYSQVFKHPEWKKIQDAGANVTFQLAGENELICQRPKVMQKLTTSGILQNDKQQCLVTGELDKPVQLHAIIKGVWGTQQSRANIVSFNLDAFNSHRKKQGYNAPVGQKAEFAYTTALNMLLDRDSNQHIQIGDATTVFWAARKNKLEEIFADFFGNAGKDDAKNDVESIRALYSSPDTGVPPLTEDLTPFFVLGLSPNASRIAVRFWHAGTVAEVSKNIVQHFADLEIIKSQNEWQNLKMQNLLRAIALQEDYKNIPPNLSGEVMKSVLSGLPYPDTLLSVAIRRIRAEQKITYQRAALIKAYLCREKRYYKKPEKEGEVSLDVTNTNIGYRFGRLFAVLERAQELASPNLNATIRERFYGSASSTPIAVFPHLLTLKNYHIAKLENKGTAVNLEKQICEIMDGLCNFPPYLSLADQGRFAIGYYHQRQAFFNKNNT